MTNQDGSFEFKVIKRIPLSKGISSKYTSDFKEKKTRLETMDVNPISKSNYSDDVGYKSVKKINLRFNDTDTTKDLSKNNFKKETKLVVENNKPSNLVDKLKLKNKISSAVKQVMLIENKIDAVNYPLEEYIPHDILLSNKNKINTITKIIDKSKSIPVVDKLVKKNISLNDSVNKSTISNLEGLLKNINNPFEETNLEKKDFFESVSDKENNVNNLLEQLNQKTNKLDQDVFLESFSFLDDKPKITKVPFESYNVKNLYSKIDSLNKDLQTISKASDIEPSNQDDLIKSNINNYEKTNNPSFTNDTTLNKKSNLVKKPINNNFGLMEEMDVPEMYALDDDVENIDHIVEDKYTVESLDKSIDSIKSLNNDSDMVSIVKTNESTEKIPNFVMEDNQIKLNSEIESKINTQISKEFEKKFNINKFSAKIDLEDIATKNFFSNLNLTKEDDQKINSEISQIGVSPKVTNVNSDVTKMPKVKKDLISEKFKDLKDKGMDYILPKDAGKNTVKINNDIYQEELSHDNGKLFASLVYTDPISAFNKDITRIFDKYSIDDFTYVNIYYDNDLGLFYNIVQPDLNADQEKEYLQIKRIFFNTIDKSYYSFNGDQHNLNSYISKVYDIALDKLSYSIGNLEKKLYLKFIEREFFGLGVLTNLLLDKKILEVSCSGEKSNVSVYHVEYGLLKTNISFPSISELNKFVLILTKNMGIYTTQAHPIIDGYLPNGYKVEGMYSVGDTSSKGSSFVIKKYLDEPLTPVSLINTSVGTVDVFSYIWSAISENYKIILVDNDDSFIIFNSLLLFYPDKKIITIQSYDRFKLPQKDWINRTFTNNNDLNKKLMIEQTISQKPDYIIVDEFDKDVFDVSWYNLNMFSITSDVVSEVIDQLKVTNQKSLVIELKKITLGSKDVLQIMSVKEIINKKSSLVIEVDAPENQYSINLLSSSINVVDFLKRKKLLRWMKDSKVYSYKDFNSIVSEFYFQKENVFKRLDIK